MSRPTLRCLVHNISFVYGAITLYGRLFQIVLLNHIIIIITRLFPVRSPLLTRISVDFFSSGYLDVSVPQVRFYNLCIQLQMTVSLQPGSPIRTSSDQCLFASSPKLFAGFHVLHRLLLPRHPPFALIYLTI